MMQPRQRLMSDNVKEEEVESKPLIYQELDDQELLDQQLQDALFGQLNDPSPGRAGSPRQRIHSDDGLFISGDDTMDEPSANADNNTRSMGFEMSASPAPSTMPQTTPAAARVETLDTGSALLLSPAPTSRTPTIPAGQVLYVALSSTALLKLTTPKSNISSQISINRSAYNTSFRDGIPHDPNSRPATDPMAVVYHRKKRVHTIQTYSDQ